MTMTSIWRNGSTEGARPHLVLIATSLGVLFAQIDTSVVNLAVRSIAGDLHAGVSSMQWVIDSYNLVYASLLLTAGTLGDLYGRRRVFILGIILFVAGTLICALATNAAMLIAGRALSGLGAAFEVAMSLVLLTAAFPDRKQRAHALGVWASCNGLAFIIGPIAGGWLVHSIGWRSIFYVILPVCAAALVLTLYAIKESANPKGRRLDLQGQVLAIVGLSAFAFVAIEGSRWGWTSQLILAIAATAAVALVLFVWVELRTPGPMLPLSYLRRAPFSAALTCAGLMTFGIYALLFIMPLYFQIVRAASPFIAGLELLPMPAMLMATSQSVGYINNRFGPRLVMTAGMSCMGLGALALAFIGDATPLVLIEIALAIVGTGLGLSIAPVNGVAVAALPPERSGTASGMVNTSRMVGATLGVAILGALFASFTGQNASVGPHFLLGVHAALAGSTISELCGAIVAIAFIQNNSLKPNTR